MITGMWCSNIQTTEFLSSGEVDIHTLHERMSYHEGSNTTLRVTHSDAESHRRDTGSFYKQHHVDADLMIVNIHRNANRSKMFASTGLSVQLRNKD